MQLCPSCAAWYVLSMLLPPESCFRLPVVQSANRHPYSMLQPCAGWLIVIVNLAQPRTNGALHVTSACVTVDAWLDPPECAVAIGLT